MQFTSARSRITFSLLVVLEFLLFRLKVGRLFIFGDDLTVMVKGAACFVANTLDCLLEARQLGSIRSTSCRCRASLGFLALAFSPFSLAFTFIAFPLALSSILSIIAPAVRVGRRLATKRSVVNCCVTMALLVVINGPNSNAETDAAACAFSLDAGP